MTERRRASGTPLVRATPLELRLYLVAILAAAYTISWRVIDGHRPAGDPVPVTPTVAPPPLAPAARASPVATPRVVRAPAPARPRVRTRSS